MSAQGFRKIHTLHWHDESGKSDYKNMFIEHSSMYIFDKSPACYAISGVKETTRSIDKYYSKNCEFINQTVQIEN